MPDLPGWLRVWYRRPGWRDIRDYTRKLNDQDIRPNRVRTPSLDSRPSTAIPSRLGLDRVLENKTCSPMSLHDFYLYLKYVEHSSENLEFYLWYKNYEANYPKSKDEPSTAVPIKDLPSLPSDADAVSETTYSAMSSVAEIVAAKQSISSLSDSIVKAEAPCARAVKSEPKWTDRIFRWSLGSGNSSKRRHRLGSGDACNARDGTCPFDVDEEKGSAVPLPLFTKHSKAPQTENRAELDAAIATYLLAGAEKELNISHTLRQRALNNLQKSSDPRFIKPVADHIYEVMKNCSHRNFVSLGVSTGTYETICVGTVIGILNILAGFLLVLLRGLYPHIGAHSRWEVFYSFPLWCVGTAVILVGTQGMCFIMLSLSRRQTLPWERFEDDGTAAPATPPASGTGWRSKYRAFMNRTMAHDKNFKVEDKVLRRLQRMVLLQCWSGGLAAAFCGVLLFIFLPIWKETVR
ncbi:hypothetical protein J7T55_012256 [Diaporthe amygdali]|uniref:uncharacterized protein n=1 Tax=Phomopsis amygdali TaxID=1214568 RepID=UPI0022FEC299|nr:uncharacterized protein J7T55_012256 [Diaporthe amygdali]KAJ0123787.1 hypothetical protein J7T55_012256 [Diaporthe amygdali]